jgi:ABC-2 type transport system permease protein
MAQNRWRRFVALLRKEMRQMLRDRSNLAVGLALPVVLILLFGYGLSFDVVNAPIAVVMDDASPTARDAVAGLSGSRYLAPVAVGGMAEAEHLLRQGKVNGIVHVPVDFSRQLAGGHARIQLLINGVDVSTASSIENYVNGAVATMMARQLDRNGLPQAGGGGVSVVQRIWFNEAANSRWYLVPGLIALVTTLIGAFLTSMLIAREWERGTLESLFVTPVRPLELTLAKLAPYVLIGAIDVAMCLVAARFLFEVPVRGSLWLIIVASLLYLVVALLLGLFISGRTRNQFVASQLALLVSFMPAMMLSGFVFDLRNVPLVVRIISELLPATHFMSLIKTLFLAGDNARLALTHCGILALYAVVLTIATTRTLHKRLV